MSQIVNNAEDSSESIVDQFRHLVTAFTSSQQASVGADLEEEGWGGAPPAGVIPEGTDQPETKGDSDIAISDMTIPQLSDIANGLGNLGHGSLGSLGSLGGLPPLPPGSDYSPPEPLPGGEDQDALPPLDLESIPWMRHSNLNNLDNGILPDSKNGFENLDTFVPPFDKDGPLIHV